jgi:3-hydroxyacyl-CoA dehydrogenase
MIETTASRAGHHAAQDQRRGDRAAPGVFAGQRGRHILEEGIASKASDIDMVYLTGYGFPLHRGGPMCYADQVGLFNVVQAMKRFAANPLDDAAFWQPAPLLAKLAAEGKSSPDRRTPSRAERATMTEAVIVSTARTPLARAGRAPST